MRILLLIRYFDFGGAENHVCELANNLHASGHTVFVASRKGRQMDLLNPAIIHYELNFSSKKAVFHFFQLTGIIRRHQIQVIHAHQRLPLTIASALARVIRIPVVATVHNMLREDIRKKWVRKGFEKVITVSGNSFTGAQRDPILRNKSLCIPNGIELPCKTIVATPEQLHFYYISRLDSRHCKLLQFLIEDAWPGVIGKYPTAKLSVVGDGKGMKEIRKLVDAIQLPDIKQSIQLKGYSPHILDIISDASLVFGVGRVAMESIAAGVPVLSIKSNRLGPIVTNENFEKLKYGNFVDIEAPSPGKEAFIKIIDDFVVRQGFYKQEALDLRKKIIQTFDIRKVVKQTIEVYEELINS